jgi:hypothetical protein
VVRGEAVEKSQARAADVERPVPVQQPPPGFAAHNRAEPEIAIASLIFGREPRRERAWFERRLRH